MPQPMDIANMLSMGIRSVGVWCSCGHQATVDVSGLDGSIAIPDLKHRLRCRKCGERPAQVMPNWSEYQPPGKGNAVVKMAHD